MGDCARNSRNKEVCRFGATASPGGFTFAPEAKIALAENEPPRLFVRVRRPRGALDGYSPQRCSAPFCARAGHRTRWAGLCSGACGDVCAAPLARHGGRAMDGGVWGEGAGRRGADLFDGAAVGGAQRLWPAPRRRRGACGGCRVAAAARPRGAQGPAFLPRGTPSPTLPPPRIFSLPAALRGGASAGAPRRRAASPSPPPPPSPRRPSLARF